MTKKIALYASLAAIAFTSNASAELMFSGIVQGVTVTTTDVGNGLDQLIINVDVGTNEFTVIEGGFVPDAGFTFNQNDGAAGNDATPAAFAFPNFINADDTVFLTPGSIGDASLDGANTNSTTELSSTTIGFTAPVTGQFDFAQLVLPTGGSASAGSSIATAADQINFILGSDIVGTIFGSTLSTMMTGDEVSPAEGTDFGLSFGIPNLLDAVTAVSGTITDAAFTDNALGIFTIANDDTGVDLGLNPNFNFSSIDPANGAQSEAFVVTTSDGSTFNFTVSAVVPEPASLALLSLGVAGVFVRRRV